MNATELYCVSCDKPELIDHITEYAGGDVYQILIQNHQIVGVAAGQTEEAAMALAHKYAAAPELYTALDDLLAELGNHIGKRNVRKHYSLMVCKEAARKALARARGEQ